MTHFFKSILCLFFSIIYVEGGNVNKKVVLIIAHEGYQPIEYCNTRKELEKADIAVMTASDKAGVAIDCFGEEESEKVTLTVKDLLKKDLDTLAGIFLIGGGGALDCLDNEDTQELMRRAEKNGLWYGAICISPRILCHAGLIDGKKITGWDNDGKLKSECAKSDVVGGPVVVDGKLITAQGPKAATEFGQAIVNALK
ncbi:TPA: hypothetical protein DIC20_04870 [Candidatus Dependentiae bacterium]|nr:MAG: Intracellular protease 1 [candidate division TM6 bacterium GW2011_GWF2_36_131]KKQ02696.1 MAG: Intracellular protease 1 [candidate division TM6 bacterium GW2011_GWE2_36_25]KKQ19583.1 MAG: Intracellular protease 1 [candidate division TM6 bacterium GW2011_GWA2_36_9]HBR71097.1 hypothetical protein [Candidatus Dependentiae bacterium]HCU01007.1 hypothetical protein [Candidatus Dependentiae bacterium]